MQRLLLQMQKKYSVTNAEPLFLHSFQKWRLVRVVEGARLESVYTGNRIEGSNPSVSAIENNKRNPSNVLRFFIADWG